LGNERAVTELTGQPVKRVYLPMKLQIIRPVFIHCLLVWWDTIFKT